jgi:excisionase family DNA binding protein
MQIEVPDELLNELAARIAARIDMPREPESPWAQLETAATYMDTSVEALRSAVKRGAIPSHRNGNGRIVFNRAELDAWMSAGARR